MCDLHGKLRNVAETTFCWAYGLNQCRKINHAILIPATMNFFKCSFRAVVHLLYGYSYHAQLSKWRLSVPGYFVSYHLNDISLCNLPAIANFDAGSHLFPIELAQNITTIPDSDLAVQAYIRRCNFSFAMGGKHKHALLHCMRYLNFHQRVGLALQVAQCMHEINMSGKFRNCGRFMLMPSNPQPIVATPVVARGTCAFFTDTTVTNGHTQSTGCWTFLRRRFNLLRKRSTDKTILEPFQQLVNTTCISAVQFTRCENRVVSHNINPNHIVIEIKGPFFFCFVTSFFICLCR